MRCSINIFFQVSQMDCMKDLSASTTDIRTVFVFGGSIVYVCVCVRRDKGGGHYI